MPDEIVRKMSSAKGRVVGERRIVTILFCDVRGSTAMAETLDPEEVMDIMNGAFEEMIAPVSRYGGTLARLMGDAILAFFGAPTAHEDDPERACRAALEIQEGIARYARRLLRERRIRDFSVRAGINTGLVVVGEVGNSVRVEYTAMGDAVNLAARMESTAGPGTIRISGNTQKFVAGTIETVPEGMVSVKGKSLPVPVFRVVGLKAGRPADRQDGHATPMVGREAESELISNTLSGLIGGSASILAVTGEAGVGKSRLISEAKKSLPAGVTWLTSRAVPYTSGTSYAMVRDLLHSATGTPADSSGETLAEALGKTVSAYSADRRDDIYPFLAWLMHLPPGEGDAVRLRKLDAESFGGRLRDSVMALLAGMAARGPLVLCWEDLHWADPSSLRTLDHLMEMARSLPVTFLLVSRPEKGDLLGMYARAPERFGPLFGMIGLEPLGRRDSGRLLVNMLGNRRISGTVKKHILDKTEGNAFFLEEVVRSIVEGGSLTPGGKKKRRGGSEAGAISIPETVQGVVTARIDRLPEEQRRVLQAASVVGRNFRLSILGSTLDPEPRKVELAGWLEDLARREFIDAASSPADPDPLFSFRHGITQDVVYGTMMRGQRVVLHRRVGEAIERLFPGKLDELASTLALHFEKAEEYDRALVYSLRAAGSASASYANREAVFHYRKALKLIGTHAASGGEPSGIHEGLGDVLALTAMYGEAVEHYRSALESAGGRDAVSRAAIRRKLGVVYERWGKYDDADRELHSALRELEPSPDTIETARINIGIARVFFRREEPDPAAILAGGALSVMDREGDAYGSAEACSILGNIAFRKGDHQAAISYYGRCLGTWEETEFLEGLAVVYNNLGQIHHQREEWDLAVVYYTKSLEMSGKTGNRYGTARTCDNLSQLYAARGRQEEATRYLRRALDIFREIGKSGDSVVPEMWVQQGTL